MNAAYYTYAVAAQAYADADAASRAADDAAAAARDVRAYTLAARDAARAAYERTIKDMTTLADSARAAADAAADAATGDVETAYTQAYALAYALEALEVPTAGLSYDDMRAELACMAQDIADRPQRAEEVTKNCHIIAKSLVRHLKRQLTPEQRAHTLVEISALHDCATEHDGAEDWLTDAAK